MELRKSQRLLSKKKFFKHFIKGNFDYPSLRSKVNNRNILEEIGEHEIEEYKEVVR